MYEIIYIAIACTIAIVAFIGTFKNRPQSKEKPDKDYADEFEFEPFFKIVGNSHHKRVNRRWSEGSLRALTQNEYDPFAIMVIDNQGEQIGWLAAGNSFVHQKLTDGIVFNGIVEKRIFENEKGEICTALRFHVKRNELPQEVYMELYSHGLEAVCHW